MQRLLTIVDLKRLLHADYARLDKLLMLLASFDVACQVKDLRSRAEEAGYREPRKWNVSAYLARSTGRAIRTSDGWEITDAGRQRLLDLDVPLVNTALWEVASDLRNALSGIADPDTRSFVGEAVGCYEAGFYRSAIVMSWVGAVAVLHTHIHNNNLTAFNREATHRNRKWKLARTTDDLGRMKESDFLDIIHSLSLIGGNVKTELQECLKRRNACGHPNSLQVRANSAAHHLEILILNVFKRF